MASEYIVKQGRDFYYGGLLRLGGSQFLGDDNLHNVFDALELIRELPKPQPPVVIVDTRPKKYVLAAKRGWGGTKYYVVVRISDGFIVTNKRLPKEKAAALVDKANAGTLDPSVDTDITFQLIEGSAYGSRNKK